LKLGGGVQQRVERKRMLRVRIKGFLDTLPCF
jgi:hypothetical protein